MTREVLPARRNWFTLRTLILAGFLSGCAAHVAMSTIPVPHERSLVPISYWHVEGLDPDEGVEWLRPALLCNADENFRPVFNGRRWSCTGGPQ